MAHIGTGRLNVKTFISSGNACSISRAFPGVWSHLLCAWVWESRWTLFTLEKSEKLGSPILKLTGPFGSNHQMCHGKKSTLQGTPSGCQHQYFTFKAGNWCQCDWVYVHQTFFPDSSTGASLTKDERLSLYFLWHTQMSQGEVWPTNRQKKDGRGGFISVTLLTRMFG